MRREKPLAYTLLAYAAAAPLLLLPRCAQAEEAAGCTQDTGRVCCTAAAFDTLSTALIDMKARLDACEARALPVVPAPSCPLLPPVAPPPSAGRPLLGLGTGVVSTLLLVTAVLAPLPTEIRGTLGTLALSGYTASVYLVLP